MFNILSKLKHTFTKLNFFKKNSLNLDEIKKLENNLYKYDFGLDLTKNIINEIHKNKSTISNKEDIINITKKIIKNILKGSTPNINWKKHKPEVIFLVGINGSGKTTTIAKLSNFFTKQGLRVLIASCDTFRAAANEQVLEWSKKLNIDIIQSHQGADPASVAYDAYESAIAKNYDILLIDTGGRLHTNINLMNELKKIKKVLFKKNKDAPHYKFLVLDVNTGSNALKQFTVFKNELDINGIIMTKLDGTSKGGKIVDIFNKFQVPIFFVGYGEKHTDISLFSIDEYINSLFN